MHMHVHSGAAPVRTTDMIALEATHEVADVHVVMMCIDALFLLAGTLYCARVLKPQPMTYLSEIAFPLDFCVKLLACVTLFVMRSLQWLAIEAMRVWCVVHRQNDTYISSNELFVLTEALVWGMASIVLWMEYRRSLTPSAYLRTFWLVQWIAAVFTLVVLEHFVDAQPSSSSSSSTLALVLRTVRLIAMTVLAALCAVRPTPISIDLVAFPQDVGSPTALLYSQSAAPPQRFTDVLAYGSFRDAEWLQKAHWRQEDTDNVAKPTAASSLEQHRQQQQQQDCALESALEHSTLSTRSSIATTISVTIPSSTTSIWGKHQFVSYKIVVQTDDDVWTVRRHYSDFVALHDELPDDIRDVCALPRNTEATGSSSTSSSSATASATGAARRVFLSWRGGRTRPMKAQLESYLRVVLNHPALEPNTSQGLCDFLEMEYIDDTLSRSYHSAPRI